ncbi:MAG: cyclopropane-fatty-acyl-phospholipid synthase family protein [Pseudomonadota bacterium]|nr:cyclopropane-fatty-acyl-phospholipid synthase family protein [Pseudomonadota bacterium]
MFDIKITNRFLAALDHIEFGAITVVTPDGKARAFRGPKTGAESRLEIHDWSVIGAMILHGDIALAESYRDGKWDSPDPAQLFLFGLQNQAALDNYIYGSVFGRIAARVAYLFTRNTLRGSRSNIQAHYDLGNDFYALWLDPTMTYSSAIFGDDKEGLQNAQTRKYDRIIDHLNRSGSLLEIGCGWGGFAERALQKGDYGIKGLTISKAQHDFAADRLGKTAHIALEDYRDQKGQYDQIVSIEMFEAVGEKFWPVYFSKLKSLLAGSGKAMVQTITIGDDYFERYRTGGDAIRTFIFPGGMLPSPSRFRQEAGKAGLKVCDDFAFGKDYATTLIHWLGNFESKAAHVKTMGFDEKFVRMWRFYLTCCIAAFRHGRIDVMQWELQHAA